MDQNVVEVIYSPERNAQIQIFRRANGTFGFAELRFIPKRIAGSRSADTPKPSSTAFSRPSGRLPAASAGWRMH